MTNADLITLRDATLGYRKQPILEAVDLTIQRGAFVGIIGPNGAGKSTLLKSLCGLIEPLAGELTRKVERIGYVPQRGALDPVYPLSVEEVVHMGAYARLSGLRTLRSEEREFATHCLERVELLERRAQRYSTLSGGQRQRALIARALMMRPELLFLDEATTGVDQPAREVILSVLSEENERNDVSILFVTHDLAYLETRVRDLIWVHGGRLERATMDTLPDSVRSFATGAQ